MATDFMTLKETADALHVSERHARRLADSGAITRVARGLVDRGSVDRYAASHRQGRTRAWAEHTAWGAIAILAGRDPAWLGATQASRLRGTIRRIETAEDLLSRLRDRARVENYAAHRSAVSHVRAVAVAADLGRLGLVDADAAERFDGYIAADEVDRTVRSLGLRAGNGNVTLRVVTLDFAVVRDLVASGLVAAIDAAESTDPRTRGVGRRAIEEVLEALR